MNYSYTWTQPYKVTYQWNVPVQVDSEQVVENLLVNSKFTEANELIERIKNGIK